MVRGRCSRCWEVIPDAHPLRALGDARVRTRCCVHDAAISCRADVGEWPLQYARSIYWPNKLARAEALGAARDFFLKLPVRFRAALTRCAGIHRTLCARPRPFEMRPLQWIRPKRALGIMFRSCALIMGMPAQFEVRSSLDSGSLLPK
jgi:hypothetical protein